MIRVRFIVSNSGLHHSYKKHQVVELPDAEARKWVRDGLAEYFEEEPVIIEQSVILPEETAIIYPRKRRRK